MSVGPSVCGREQKVAKCRRLVRVKAGGRWLGEYVSKVSRYKPSGKRIVGGRKELDERQSE